MKTRFWSTWLVVCLVVVITPAILADAHGLLAPAGRATAAPPLLQFTSGAHVLGFATNAAYVAGGSHSYRVSFVNAAPVTPISAALRPELPLAGGISAGRAARPTRVIYPNLWQGITLMYDVPDGAILRSTYRLEPYADPGLIRLHYNAPAQIARDGTLALTYATGIMRESAPLAWQERDGAREFVNVAFTSTPASLSQAKDGEEGAKLIGFSVAAYDPARPLFIDPTLTWHTFLGGTGKDSSAGVAVDGSGNSYVVGRSDATWGAPIEAYSGSGFDVFVAKLDADGALIWNTFLGGNMSDDYGYGIAVDGAQNVYVTGESSTDAFVAKLGSDGGGIWVKFFGTGGGLDEGFAVAVDGDRNVYVAGASDTSWGTPVRNYTTGWDAFVAKLDNSGTLIWHTFLGGSAWDYGHAIAVEDVDHVYVAGRSYAAWGSPIRAYTSGADAFAAKLNRNGGLTWHTFLGGSGTDYGRAIAVDSYDNAYVAGDSNVSWGAGACATCPIRAHVGNYDAFVVKLDSGGAITWNTFLGGNNVDYGYGIALDESANVYVTGQSRSSWSIPVRAYHSNGDAFAARLDTNGALMWNAFLGGSGQDDGRAVAVGGGRNMHLAGFSGAAWGAPKRPYSGDNDALIAKLALYYYIYLPLIQQ